MSFLPEGYKEPVTSNYMSLEEGDNTIRILTSAITGFEYWIDEKKEDGSVGGVPKRVKSEEEIPPGLTYSEGKFGPQEPKFFWAFVVYNFRDERVQVLQIHQASIRKAILPIVQNKKWGDPKEYNLVITKTKDGGKTTYSVTPEPKEKLDKSITDRFESMNIDLNALYEGKDPFGKSEPENEDIDPESVPL